MTEFLGLKEQALQFRIGGFPLDKIVHGQMREINLIDGQWQLERANLISDEGSSELNGKS